MNKTHLHTLYFVLAMFAILFFNRLWHTSQTTAVIPYSEFQQLLKDKKIAEIEVTTDNIRGSLKSPSSGKTGFVTTRIDQDLVEQLQASGAKYTGKIESTFLPTLLSWILPVVFFVGLWALVIRRMGNRFGSGSLMSIGKSKAKVYVEADTKVSFADVAGVDEAKHELQETVAFLKDPQSHGRLGARMPKGILLLGPPGTGKTLLARAVAGEAGVPFFSMSGSAFVEMFVGVGAARVRDLFEQARLKAPCIIFIDELDALGRARNANIGMGGHDEKEQTLNQLLVELDGFDPTSGIVLLAATNRPEILDPALLRAGRFDRQVLLDRPDRKGRVEILQVHLRKVQVDTTLDPEILAALTPGFTGADLANLVNEAALLATRRAKTAVDLTDFTEAIERIVAGLEKKNRLLNVFERQVVAHHELGHAFVAAALSKTETVHKVSIVARGVGSLGYTIARPTEERYLMTAEELEHKMAALLGGRAAESLMFGHLSTGASDDLVKATGIARAMVTRYAMVPELGPVAYDADQPTFLPGSMTSPMAQRNYGEETARQIDTAIRKITAAALTQATSILQENRALLEESAQLLLERETLSEHELKPLFARIRRVPPLDGPTSATRNPVTHSGGAPA